MVMTISKGNIGAELPAEPVAEEIFERLTGGGDVLIERIVSTGQATPEGEWYDQERDEWVMVVSGAARLLVEGEEDERDLSAGDWLLLPAHCRHRVTWTQDSPPTVWLAVHYPPNPA